MLLDAWFRKNHKGDYDDCGTWAHSGELNQSLLELLLDQPYFSQPPPKSTGREQFCLQWLEELLQSGDQALPAANVQRTLVELTARTFADCVHAPLADDLRKALTMLFQMRWPAVESELSPEDLETYQRICLPESPDFILNQPDYCAFYTYSMFSGMVPIHIGDRG